MIEVDDVKSVPRRQNSVKAQIGSYIKTKLTGHSSLKPPSDGTICCPSGAHVTLLPTEEKASKDNEKNKGNTAYDDPGDCARAEAFGVSFSVGKAREVGCSIASTRVADYEAV